LKHILISYDYFYPGYKAGGPIQSLVNLVILLQNDYKISVLTGAYDHNETSPYENIKINDWNKVYLPNNLQPVNVWYADTKQLSYKTIKQIIKDTRPDIVYINSMYSLFFMLYPLIVLKRLKISSIATICPRGMLQDGALQVKAGKKEYFLKALKFFGLLNNISWHATNLEEKNDINLYFPNNNITVAHNIPKIPLYLRKDSQKVKGKLNLIYLSLISEKKNLHLLLQVILKSDTGVTLDIYGPVKDNKYWNDNCVPLIDKLKHRVTYNGDILPLYVQDKLSEYDALALLTKGENFGHALYESLSVGRPIITSYFTPWNTLEKENAGWNVDINNLDKIANLFNWLILLDKNEFDKYCKGAYSLAEEYYNSQNFMESYNLCF